MLQQKTMLQRIQSIIEASIDAKSKILADADMLSRIEEIVYVIVRAFKNGHRIYFCGNGGSASDAQHLAAEFSGRFYMNRKALPAEALHCNSSYLTAVGNDYGFEVIYARLVSGIMEKGDVLLGLSTSGNSPNIVKAFEVARSKEITTVGFTGEDGGQLKLLSDYLFNIPSRDTPRIQESHILVGHIICELVESAYFKDEVLAKG